MSQYLPNLRRLDLSYSKELEKIIEFGEFPNLEWLNLEKCDNLVKLDPSIGLLKKLVYLNVKDCYNLVSIPSNIFSLSSLEYLNMSGCPKAFNNSLPSPTTLTYLLPSSHSLYCLRDIDISFCHLSQVPDSIEYLCSLERLNLGGNDFVRLPSLRKLSKLVYLNLEHCKLLESLPQLPSPTTIRRERDEIDEIDEIFGMRKKITGLLIFSCPKLGDKERCSSITFLWIMKFIQANPQSYPAYFDKIHIVTPGSDEIPSWINNQSVGDSIQIDRSPVMHDSNNNIIGFLCCAVFSMALHRERSPQLGNIFQVIFNPYVGHPFQVRFPAMLGDLVTTKSSYLWIIYLPGDHKFREIRFDNFFNSSVECMEVKSCGYRWVCKEDLQELNLTTMNHENSLAGKCKILAIENETQPEQESYISQVITTSQRSKSTSDNKSTAKTISVVNRKQRYVILLCYVLVGCTFILF